MTIPPLVVGIDISRDHLDIYDPAIGRAERFPNSAATATGLAQRFAGDGVSVVFEATGHYDTALRRALAKTGVAYSRVNPARARDFARAAGYLAKTDAVDARMLADMGRRLELTKAPEVDPDRERLALLNRRRDQLVSTRQQERVRRKAGGDAAIDASIAAHLDWLDGEIEALEAAIADLIKASPALLSLANLLRSVPGVGPVTAATLIALAPELGHRSPKSIAALAGLAPINADSGRYRGQRSIRGGRKRIRNALYVAAVVASRTKSRFATFYRTLRDAGKSPKQAFVALARKLLVTLNAIARDREPFHA